jgi:hypothetical protein
MQLATKPVDNRKKESIDSQRYVNAQENQFEKNKDKQQQQQLRQHKNT